jgi:hypothetical protein
LANLQIKQFYTIYYLLGKKEKLKEYESGNNLWLLEKCLKSSFEYSDLQL